MKIAHLILAHNQPKQLERLIGSLSHPDADIFVHVDAKTDIEPFIGLQNIKNVFFIRNRTKVYWGSFSMVQATLNCFEEIARTGKKYGFINLLSGQDYPLKPQQFINDFLEANKGTIFMNYLLFEDDWQEALPRINKYHLNNFNFPGRFLVQKLINLTLPARRIPDQWTPVGRSQWFTIPLECMVYILEFWKRNKQFQRFMKLTWAPDEFIFQTILYNSIHRSRMVNNDLRYIDWSVGGSSPKTLTIEDIGKLSGSDKLFARKFDLNKDEHVFDYIDKVFINKKIDCAL